MDQQTIYRERAEEYDRLIAAEDCDGHLLPALQRVASLRGKRVLDIGAGTGRLSRLVLEQAGRVVALAGWVFGHLRSWLPADWSDAIGAALREMTRVVYPGGTMVVIETLTTGSSEPRAPSPQLGEYYDWLEREWGFTRHAIRTDYRFPDVETAAKICGFFFGEDFGRRVVESRMSRVPECTGIWSRSR